MNSLLRRHAVISHAVFAQSQSVSLRTFTTSRASYEQHLLWSGTLLDQTTDTFKPLNQDLLLAAGAGPDLLKGDVSLSPPAASPTRGHSLLPYRTAQPEALSRVLAIGRNTHAQLGIGYASQEATFGLIRSGYSGRGGISEVIAGQHQSWILTNDESETAIEGTFACGNNTLGQVAKVMIEESGQHPQLLLIPAPKRVVFVAKADAIVVEKIALGLDHVVGVATSQDEERPSQWRSTVVTCGLNTDGQLGRKLEPHLIDDHLSQTHSSAFSALGLYTEGPTRKEAAQWQIAAGGDTSYAWTAERVYAWGNNEYGQCLGTQEELGDQVATPKDVTNQLRVAMGSKVKLKDVKILGSCVLFLDDRGHVYSTGHGPSGRDPRPVNKYAKVVKIPSLPPIDSISVSLDSVLAVTKCGRRLFAWGLDANGGNLGLGSWSGSASSSSSSSSWQGDDILRRVKSPQEINVTRWLGEKGRITSTACGGDQSWILCENGEEPIGVWRGSQPRGLQKA